MRKIGGLIATVLLLAAVLFILGCPGDLWRPDRTGGKDELRIDPTAALDSAKEYRLVFWDYRLPVVTEDGSGYEELVAEAIAAFQTLYPNVTIEYRLLSVIDGRAELEKALAAGTPPDVYGGRHEPAIIDSVLQVPAGLYFDEATRAEYAPAALAGVSAANEIQAWPRWISPRCWTGNGSLLAAAGVDVASVTGNGWTWGEFEQAAVQLPAAGSKNYPLLLNDAGLTMFEDVLLNSAAAQAAIKGEERIWNGAALGDTFARIDTLRQKQILPAGTNMQSMLLTAYGDGKVMAAGGLGMWLLGKERERQQRRAQGLLPAAGENETFATVLLPIPHDEGAENLLPIDVGSVTVFRQSAYRGDDCTRAAAEFAAFISRELERTIADHLFFVPARLRIAEAWLADAPLSYVNRRICRQALQNGFAWQAGEIGRCRPDEAALSQIGGICTEFWSGKISASDAAAAVAGIIGDGE